MHMTASPTLKRKRDEVARSEITKKEYSSLTGSPLYASTTPSSETLLTHFSSITHTSHSPYPAFHRAGDDLPKGPSQVAPPPKKRLKPLKSTKPKATTFIDLVPPSSPTNTRSLKALERCHKCSRRPTTKAFLNAYVDCEDCGARTCFICIRECEAGNCLSNISRDNCTNAGGGRRICAACCVEDGVEGVIYCRDCRKRDGKGHEDEN